MAKCILVLVFLVSICTISWALKCKSCAPSDPTCKTLEDTICSASPSDKEVACLSHKYKASKDSKEEIIEKKCVNRPKGGKYDCITHSSTEVELQCETCTTDLCNVNSASKITSVTIFSLVVALVVSKFL